MDRSVYDVHFSLDRDHFWRRGKRRLVEQLLPRALQDAGVTPGSLDILDIGGACSVITKELEAFGTVTCIEPDDKCRALADECLGVKTLAGALPDEINVDRKYDVITMLDVLEHIDDDHRSLEVVRDLLKPDGVFICSVPALPCLWSDHDVVLHHKRRYRKRQLLNMFSGAGLESIRTTYYTSLLLPLLAIQRLISRATSRIGDSKPTYRVTVPPGPINGLLSSVMTIERWLIRFMDLPIGSALITVARKAKR